jgi:hypothetical protein
MSTAQASAEAASVGRNGVSYTDSMWTHGSGGSYPTTSLPARTIVRVGHWSTSGPQILNIGLSGWELACHTFPTTVFAGQGLFVLSVDDCH